MNIKPIAVGVCLTAVAAGVYQATYKYPSMVQAKNACYEWRAAGGTYEYEYETHDIKIDGYAFRGTPNQIPITSTVTTTKTETTTYRSCYVESETNQYLGYQNKGEGTNSKVVKHFRF